MVKTVWVLRAEDLFKRMMLETGEPNKLEIKFPIQRPENQWNNEMKGRFVQAILLDDPIPPLYMTHNIRDLVSPTLMLDGKQRLTSLFKYVNNGYRLWKNTPSVTYTVYEHDENGNPICNEYGVPQSHQETYEIAGKYFKQLPQKLQKTILNFRFDCYMLSEFTADDLSRVIYNLNNGKPATATQKSIMKLGLTLGKSIEDLTKNDLFENRVVLTAGQEKNSEAHKMILCSLMLWTGAEDEEVTYKNLSNSSSLNNFSEHLANTWTKIQLDEMNNMLTNLDNLLPEDNSLCAPYLNATHLPVIIMNIDKYNTLCEDGLITEEQYREFLDYWFKKGVKKYSYTKFSGKNINDKANVEGRIEAMDKELLRFIGLEDDEELIDDEFTNTIKEYFPEVSNEEANDVTLHALMATTGIQYVRFSTEMENDYTENVLNNDKGAEKVENINLYADMLRDYIGENTIADINQIPMYLVAVQEAVNKGYDDRKVKEWFDKFIKKCSEEEVTMDDDVYFGIADDNYNKYSAEGNSDCMISIVKKSICDYCIEGE